MLYLLNGLSLASAKLPNLWRYFRDPIVWLLASMIGWIVLVLIVDTTIGKPSDLVSIGVIHAIFTGLGLIWLIRTPRTKLDYSPLSMNITE
jgi:hypothetical protein